ncbi:hypothetical protein LJC44_00830 [Parabacteroides sp. OttesenSCG-928-G06]|nr:hypothetical protein [Parabacteroides sp. OttesenSCG-928-G06]
MKKKKISRREFVQICGSVVAGGSILGGSAVLLSKRGNPNLADVGAQLTGRGTASSTSPYRLIAEFTAPDPIEAFELYDNKLIAAAANTVYIYDLNGKLLNSFAIGSNLRDIAADGGLIYLLFPTHIEVYNDSGEMVRDWEACSPESDYCSLALAPGIVFVTDTAAKNICKYTTEGAFVRFIQSPNRFIIPSYSFGIAYADGVIYCSNSGRHLVESYTPEGEYIAAFGEAGNAAGTFCGCCNPVHLTHTASGDIITSEKGNPRISCYSPEGEFRTILLDEKTLGGGNAAYDVKVAGDRLFVAGKNRISTYRYDKTLAATSACSVCKANCPLREGLTI